MALNTENVRKIVCLYVYLSAASLGTRTAGVGRSNDRTPFYWLSHPSMLAAVQSSAPTER